MARTKGRSRISLTVDESGPFFDEAYTAGVINSFVEDLKDELAQMGHDEVHRRFEKKFKQKTGAYEGRVVVDRAGEDRVVTDNGVIYGPWLEGTSRRNRSTHWKGYSSFRLTRLWLRRQVNPTAQGRLERALVKLR